VVAVVKRRRRRYNPHLQVFVHILSSKIVL
jgi:hypothetical protein